MPESPRVPIAHPTLPGRVIHAAESTVAGWRIAGWLPLHELDEASGDAPASDDAPHDNASAPDGPEAGKEQE